jgi:hypothetical protein
VTQGQEFPLKGYLFQTVIGFRLGGDVTRDSASLASHLRYLIECKLSLIDWSLVYGLEGTEENDSAAGADPYEGTGTLGVTMLITGMTPEEWLAEHIWGAPGIRHYTTPNNVRVVRIEKDYAEGDLTIRRVEYVVSPKMVDWDDAPFTE